MAILAEVVVFFDLIRIVAPAVPLIVGLAVILLTIGVAFLIGRIKPTQKVRDTWVY